MCPYDLFTYIYHKELPEIVGKYTIHSFFVLCRKKTLSGIKTLEGPGVRLHMVHLLGGSSHLVSGWLRGLQTRYNQTNPT